MDRIYVMQILGKFRNIVEFFLKRINCWNCWYTYYDFRNPGNLFCVLSDTTVIDYLYLFL